MKKTIGQLINEMELDSKQRAEFDLALFKFEMLFKNGFTNKRKVIEDFEKDTGMKIMHYFVESYLDRE